MTNPKFPPSCDELILFMVEYGRLYLASGGPTSRLEEALSALGPKMGYPTEVYATPTGIFVSCVDQAGNNHTTLARIKDNSINFSKLCWLESIFEELSLQKLSLSRANKILHSRRVIKSPYSFLQSVIAAFMAGFSLSLPTFGNVKAALASGLISTATWWVAGPGLKKRIPSSIFRDFFGCIVTLTLASLLQFFLKSPFESLTIGGLIVLVPGLTITTAISELADQNLISGTAKLMQGVLTLLALSLAYLLFYNISEAFGVHSQTVHQNAPLSLALSIFGALISVSCFGILFHVPKKSLPWSALTGALGWFIIRKFKGTDQVIAASFFASLMVGTLSLWFGKKFKVPSQVFSVPGILAMLPGMLAFNSLQSIALGNQASGITLGFQVALTAGSIVFGLFMARIPFIFRNP